jgi:hypothetical protein
VRLNDFNHGEHGDTAMKKHFQGLLFRRAAVSAVVKTERST